MNPSEEMRASEQPEEVQVAFTLQLKQGQIEATATVPTARMTLTQLLPVLQGISSSIVSAVEERVREQGTAISCKAGCGACCRQLVTISLFEAEALASWIDELPEEQQAILQGRFHDAIQTLHDTGFLENLDPAKRSNLSEAENQAFLLEYLRQRVACPFLVDESCSIYPIRPLICREYLVTSPPEFCANPTAETLQAVKMPVSLNLGLVRTARVLPGESNGRIPLLFLMAWKKRNARPGDSFTGTGPELLARFLQECGPRDELQTLQPIMDNR